MENTIAFFGARRACPVRPGGQACLRRAFQRVSGGGHGDGRHEAGLPPLPVQRMKQKRRTSARNKKGPSRCPFSWACPSSTSKAFCPSPGGLTLAGVAALGFGLHAGLATSTFCPARPPSPAIRPCFFTAAAAMRAGGGASCLAVGLLPALLLLCFARTAQRDQRSCGAEGSGVRRR
jgi:hypothetical protein